MAKPRQSEADAMLEKVSRAMFTADSYDNSGRVWEEEGQMHGAYRAMAWAALMAIREPSDGLVHAVALRGEEFAGMGWSRIYAASFTAMIDAILTGEA